MSITYDPIKWSNPLRARDFEATRKRSKAPVLVSLREFRYFKNDDARESGTDPIAALLADGRLEEYEYKQRNEVLKYLQGHTDDDA
jgi:hypothetical protein